MQLTFWRQTALEGTRRVIFNVSVLQQEKKKWWSVIIMSGLRYGTCMGVHTGELLINFMPEVVRQNDWLTSILNSAAAKHFGMLTCCVLKLFVCTTFFHLVWGLAVISSLLIRNHSVFWSPLLHRIISDLKNFYIQGEKLLQCLLSCISLTLNLKISFCCFKAAIMEEAKAIILLRLNYFLLSFLYWYNRWKWEEKKNFYPGKWLSSL